MRSFLTLTILLLFAAQLYSQERKYDEAQARLIFDEVENRNKSIESEKAVVEMVITDLNYRTTQNRTLQVWKKNNGNESMSLFVFSAPESLRGTSLLTVNEENNRIRQLYLPSIQRFQIIGMSEKGDRFMGSDFTYEDLGDLNPDDYEPEWLEINDSHYTIRAKKPDSDRYAYMEFVITKDTYALRTIRFFDVSDTMIKYLESENFEQLTDKLWSPKKITLHDLQENRKTELIWSNRIINPFIEDWRFTEKGLRTGI